jgi:hypothetical protein
MTASDTPGVAATPNKINEHRKIRFSLLTITLSHPLAYQLKEPLSRTNLHEMFCQSHWPQRRFHLRRTTLNCSKEIKLSDMFTSTPGENGEASCRKQATECTLFRRQRAFPIGIRANAARRPRSDDRGTNARNSL